VGVWLAVLASSGAGALKSEAVVPDPSLACGSVVVRPVALVGVDLTAGVVPIVPELVSASEGPAAFLSFFFLGWTPVGPGIAASLETDGVVICGRLSRPRLLVGCGGGVDAAGVLCTDDVLAFLPFLSIALVGEVDATVALAPASSKVEDKADGAPAPSVKGVEVASTSDRAPDLPSTGRERETRFSFFSPSADPGAEADLRTDTGLGCGLDTGAGAGVDTAAADLSILLFFLGRSGVSVSRTVLVVPV
jgi:hypothetical protein